MMKYVNASDILPEELLKQLRQYAAGQLLYIPSTDEKKGWGESSGYRDQLRKRNQMIRNKYAHGLTVSELADEYYLSLDSIKKIIYSKKADNQLMYYPTVQSAVQYVHAGMIEEWVQCFLDLTLQASSKLEEFMKEEFLYFGVVKFPLRLIERENGEIVEALKIEVEEEKFVQPLIIQYVAGKFYCMLQQNLLAILKQQKINVFPTIIVMQGNTDYKRFMKYYGNIFFYVDDI